LVKFLLGLAQLLGIHCFGAIVYNFAESFKQRFHRVLLLER